MESQESKSEREIQWERRRRQERNALTIMSLPVRMPADWYGRLPRVMPLIPRSAEQSKFYISEDVARSFLQMWKERLIKYDGNSAWMSLGGLECYDSIPKFVNGVERSIRGYDREITEQRGIQAVIQHWRTSIKELANSDNTAVLNARVEITNSLLPLMSTIAMASFWAESFVQALEDIHKVRSEIHTWMARHEQEWNLDKPFGGKLPYQIRRV